MTDSDVVSSAGDRSIWVYYGGDMVVDALLKENLDKHLELVNSYNFGTKEIFFTEIL